MESNPLSRNELEQPHPAVFYIRPDGNSAVVGNMRKCQVEQLVRRVPSLVDWHDSHVASSLSVYPNCAKTVVFLRAPLEALPPLRESRAAVIVSSLDDNTLELERALGSKTQQLFDLLIGNQNLHALTVILQCENPETNSYIDWLLADSVGRATHLTEIKLQLRAQSRPSALYPALKMLPQLSSFKVFGELSEEDRAVYRALMRATTERRLVRAHGFEPDSLSHLCASMCAKMLQNGTLETVTAIETVDDLLFALSWISDSNS